jgi:hypothetical protein
MNAPQRVRASLKGASLMAFALLLLAAGATAVAGPDSTDPKHPKPSSFAPRPTAKRAFGAPIQPPIVHKRHKKAARPTGNQAAAARSNGHGEPPK